MLDHVTLGVSDIEFDAGNDTVKTRKAMETAFSSAKAAGAPPVPA